MGTPHAHHDNTPGQWAKWALVTPFRWIGWMFAATTGRVLVLIPATVATGHWLWLNINTGAGPTWAVYATYLIPGVVTLGIVATAAGTHTIRSWVLALLSVLFVTVTTVTAMAAVLPVAVIGGTLLLGAMLLSPRWRRRIPQMLTSTSAGANAWGPFASQRGDRYTARRWRDQIGTVFWVKVPNVDPHEPARFKTRPAVLIGVEDSGELQFLYGTSQDRSGQFGYIPASDLDGWPVTKNSTRVFVNVRDPFITTADSVVSRAGQITDRSVNMLREATSRTTRVL